MKVAPRLCAARRTVATLALAGAAIVPVAAVLPSADASAAGTKVPAEMVAAQLSTRDRSQIEKMLTAELQRIVDKQPRLPGQSKLVKVQVRLDTSSRAVIIDLSPGYVPKVNGIEFEEQRGELSTAVWTLLQGIIRTNETRFTYGGKSIYKYFPQDQPRPQKSSSVMSTGTGPIVVSAGHGYYYDHDRNLWSLQRDPANGVQEDYITIAFANNFVNHATSASRLGAQTTLVRFNDPTSSTSHTASGLHLWKMSAREYLKGTIPTKTHIWNSMPNATHGLRERDEDIRARPLYANDVNASVLISFHTNAANGTARGTRIYHYPGRSVDKAIADNMLCYVAEIVRSQKGYETFPVASEAHAEDHGENRLATMPAVIVEAAFHDNARDAMAIKDANFRTALAKGVEKGYRLWKQGHGCLPYALLNVQGGAAPHGEEIPVDVSFRGFPQAPLRAEVRFDGCPTGYTCTNSTKSLTVTGEGTGRFTMRCATDTRPTQVFQIYVRLLDGDGAATQQVPTTVSCLGTITPAPTA